MTAPPIFDAEQVHKRYGAVQALDGAELSVRSGEVHGLVGENGAGKSTLVRIAAGLLVPDRGALRLAGTPYQPRSPLDAARHGVGLVSQEFDLAPNVSVAENLCLSSHAFRARERGGRFPWKRALAWAAEQLEAAGVMVAPRRLVRDLSVTERQLVALVRGVLDDPQLVFLDEPSSALDQESVQVLVYLVEQLRERGVAVVYVSHKMEEILSLTDRVTVMRDGRTVSGHVTAETTEARIVTDMVGREVAQLFPARPTTPPGQVVLEARQISAPGVAGVDLVVREGEILGIGGLVGAGRTELAKAIAGLAPVHDGELLLDGQPARPRDRRHALELGIEYVTEDRLGEGLVLIRSLADNVSARVLRRFCTGPLVRGRAVRRFGDEQVTAFRIAAPDSTVPVGALSGGNQQKTLLAACLASDPKVVFFDEPTRGIDVGAKAQIYDLIRQLARERAVVVVSAELIELLGLADRIVIMRQGRFVAEYAASDATEELLVAAALGVTAAQPSPDRPDRQGEVR